MLPTVGRVVLYCLRPEDITEMIEELEERRRADMPDGHYEAHEFDEVAADIVRVYDAELGIVCLRLKIYGWGLDRALAVPNVKQSPAEGARPGHWRWPPRT